MCGCSNEAEQRSLNNISEVPKQMAVFYNEILPENCQYEPQTSDYESITSNGQEIARRRIVSGYTGELTVEDFMLFWNGEIGVKETEKIESTQPHMYLYRCKTESQQEYYIAFCEAHEEFPAESIVYEVLDTDYRGEIEKLVKSLWIRQELK
jgi:hypothetical protein